MIRIIQQYTQSHRKYHTLNHIFSMINNSLVFTELNEIQKNKIKICYFISQAFLEHLMNDKIIFDESLVLRSQLGAAVSVMITDTKNHLPSFNLSKYLIDLDFWELADKDTYSKNRELVLSEYDGIGITEDELLYGRKYWLESMLKREQIFYTNFCINANFEDQARKNLKNELRNF